jgi:ribosome-associated translation inhibitor RaiA
VDIVFHAHHAVISEDMRARAARTVTKVATRMPRVTSAIVRFEESSRVRRVVIELHASGRKVVADGQAPFFGTALADAGARLLARVHRERRDKNKKHTMRTRRRTAPRAAAGPDLDGDALTDTGTA